MRHVTRRQLAAVAAKRWKTQYDQSHVTEVNGKPKELICNQLIALGPSPDPNSVDNVIGNTSWTWYTCDNCDGQVAEAVVLENPDYDKQFTLCKDCWGMIPGYTNWK